MDKNKVVKITVEKLMNYEEMKALMENPANSRSALGEVIPWDHRSLCAGLPGISLVFSQLLDEAEDDRMENVAKDFISKAVEQCNRDGYPDLSLHNGMAGLGLAITSLAKKTGGYENALKTINGTIADNSKGLIARVDAKAIIGYDIISGLAGITSYLLLHLDDDVVYHTAEEFVDALINFTIGDSKTGGWLVPPQYLFSDDERTRFPHGAYNSGYAHGIAGVLGVLAKAYKKGIKRPGQTEAIKLIMDYYEKFKILEDDRFIWKGQLSSEEYDTVMAGKANPGEGDFFRRDAWCYGAPGICYGLLQATDVVTDADIRRMAMDNMKKAIQKRDANFSPSFCHGYSGLLQIAKASQNVVGQNFLQEECDVLERLILDTFDKRLPFGFCDHEYSPELKDFRDYHEPGLLNGSTGIVLALQDDGSGRGVYQSAFGL